MKGCGFSTVEGLYVENMASDPADFDNYSDGTFSHNMEWMTYEAVQFIKADDEEVSNIFHVLFSKLDFFAFLRTHQLVPFFLTPPSSRSFSISILQYLTVLKMSVSL